MLGTMLIAILADVTPEIDRSVTFFVLYGVPTRPGRDSPDPKREKFSDKANH